MAKLPPLLAGSTSDRALFLLARAAAVVIRPACLVAIARWIGAGTADQVARLMVVSGLALIISAFDSGKLYYTRIFSRQRNPAAFHGYLSRLLVATIPGIAATIVLLWYFGFDRLGIAAGCLFYVSERYVDEYQRYLLIDGANRRWSTFQLWRLFAQAGFLALLTAAIVRLAVPPLACWFILALGAGNLVAPIGWHRFQTLAALPARPVLFWQSLRKGAGSLAHNFSYWPASIMASAHGYLDRIFILSDRDTQAAGALVVIGAAGIMQVVVSALFFSANRRRIAMNEVHVSELLRSSFARAFGLGLLGSLVALYFALVVLPPEARPSTALIAVFFLLQITFTFTGILREVLFFRVDASAFVKIDGLALIASLLLIPLARAFSLPFLASIIGLLLVQAARCWILWRANRAHERQRSAT